MPPAPRPDDEKERLEKLRSYMILDSVPEESFDEITSLASDLLGVPVALISFIDEDRQWFKSKIGLKAEETRREHAFCAYAVSDRKPFIVENAATNDKVKDNPLVTGDPNIRFYAGSPLETSSGHILGTLCVIDFKERKFTDRELAILNRLAKQVVAQLELRLTLQQLSKLNKELYDAHSVTQDALKCRARFLATMSHEIRTPITAIMGLAEVLVNEEEVSALDSKQAARTICDNSRYLLDVINNLLDLSKAESNKIELEKLDVSLFHLVRDVESLVKLKAIEKDIRFSINYDFPLPQVIHVDPTRLKQVLVNFVNNAIKFTEAGSVTLHVAFHKNDSRLSFDIVDTGIGMKDEELDRLFQPFQQANSSINRKYGGTGLGLTISKELIEKMNGEIRVTSELGKGSSFRFSLPDAVQGEVQLVDEKPESLEQRDRTVIPSLKGKVLVVEDEPINQKLISHLLRQTGLDTVLAGDGESGYEKARTGGFDLIFMDMQLPKMSGIEVVQALGKEKINTPIVALTATQNTEVIGDFLEAGCVEYVPKPFNRRALYDCLKRYLSRNSSDREKICSFLIDERYAGIILKYTQGLTNRLQNIQSSFEETNWDLLCDEAHRLVGAGLYGYDKISFVAKLLEEQALKHETEACKGLIDRLTVEISAAQKQ